MAVASTETPKSEKSTVADRIVDAARHAAHLSHEARFVKSLAHDAIEDGAHAAKRAAKSVARGMERLEDIKDESIHYVKRQPAKAIVMAAGLGLVAGMAAGWVCGRCSKPQNAEHSALG